MHTWPCRRVLGALGQDTGQRSSKDGLGWWGGALQPDLGSCASSKGSIEYLTIEPVNEAQLRKTVATPTPHPCHTASACIARRTACEAVPTMSSAPAAVTASAAGAELTVGAVLQGLVSFAKVGFPVLAKQALEGCVGSEIGRQQTAPVSSTPLPRAAAGGAVGVALGGGGACVCCGAEHRCLAALDAAPNAHVSVHRTTA